MIVKELIEKLKEIDPDVEVFAPGYEDGFRDIYTDFKIETFTKDVNDIEKLWWLGPHEQDKNGITKAIVL